MMWLAGYLAKERKGKQVFYRMADERINSLVDFMEELFLQRGDDECSCDDE
jgi:DNA-binding transcriptional regulator PaaX